MTEYIETSESEQEAVYSWLRDYNHEENGEFMRSLEVEGTEIPIFLSTKDDSGNVVGGLEGKVLHKWLQIHIMAVAPNSRQRGIGKGLVSRAEKIAIEQDCQYAFVDTMSYQAPGFYESLGYQVVGRIPDWDSHGHEKLYFTKTIC